MNLLTKGIKLLPKNNQNKSVLQLVKEIKKHWKSVSWKIKKNKHDKKESKLLKLNSKKSKKFLKWEPILNFEQSVKMTSDWYNKYYSTNENCYNLSSNQILSYEQIIKKRIKEKKLGIFK